MARHSKSVNISLGSPKAGRPVADKPLTGPDCKICRHSGTTHSGRAFVCLKGYVLEPCEEFSDASKPRQIYGGLTGIFTP